MKYYFQSSDEVLNSLSTSSMGLTNEEAASRLSSNGKNKLKEPEKDSLLKRFLSQLADPMIIILIVAAAISATTAIISTESFADVFIILFVVIINAVLGVLQESKAEKAIEALKEMSAATSKVYRSGEIAIVHSEDLVVGDVIILEAGDAVPADVRIIESMSLQSEESALTGESVPVSKISDALPEADNIPLGDRTNMAFSGSTIVYGRGRAVVTATGMDTEIGKIADAISNAQEGDTPLQIKLAQLSKILTWVVLGICVFIFLFSLVRSMLSGNGVTGPLVLDIFILAVSLAVAAIPEGLVAVVTIVLSMGVTRMAKRNAVIRRLTAVETLGCTQIICSDKTGTLTQNKMTVTDHYGEKNLLASGMALCSDAELNSDGSAQGEPTECALVNYASKLGISKNDLKALYPRVGEAPFDSSRKMMSTVHKTRDCFVQYTKGAPDVLLSLCTSYMENGEVLPMTEKKREEILADNKRMAGNALRVLALASRQHTSMPEDCSPKALERDLTFVGLCGMIDPVRPEVKAAIEECSMAGIRPIMITGDHFDTAVAIAKELGIITDSSQAATGAMLDKLTDDELKGIITKFSVYARVQPEHKVKIVNAWRSLSKITAMTGDGVNDAPSIKNADIGVGMGITGTDVTKNVADMVLADDNFATIVKAVEEGRRIYDNIRRAIQFLLASNLSEVLSIFFATMMGFTILKPVHLLWINLITDAFPALALGVEKGEADIMQRQPRKAKDGIFSGGMGTDIAYQGILSTILVVASYFIGHYIESGVWEIAESQDGMTMAFLTMCMMEIFHSINMRSQRGSIFTIKGQNMLLWGAMVLSIILVTVVIYVPSLSQMFDLAHISLAEYFTALGIGFLIIPMVELVKLFQRMRVKHEAEGTLSGKTAIDEE